MSLNDLHPNSKKIKKNDLRSNFRKAMFWDVEMDKLSIKHDKFFIIDRVLSRSMKNSIYLDRLEKFYSIKDIKEVAKSSRSIRGNESIRFIANRYAMNPKSFKQYIPNL